MQFIGFAYFHHIARKVLLLLSNYSLEKSITDSARTVCNLHSFYDVGHVLYQKMDSFSADQKRIIFFVYLITHVVE